jgi:signal peptidase I
MVKEKINRGLSALKKLWNFLWNDESWLSWISFMVIAFILIRFVFFPTLSLMTGTKLPIVIVESCSMYHGMGFDDWWGKAGKWYEEKGIYDGTFSEFGLKNGFSKGDIFFVLGTKKEKLKEGDIIIFASGTSNRPIIHRVVSLNPLQTKGDNNLRQFNISEGIVNPEQIDETNIQESQIIGKVVGFKIPFLGWIKLIFFEPFRNPAERGFCHSSFA